MIYIYALNAYHDVQTEVTISKIRIQGLKDEKKILEASLRAPKELNCQQYSDMPHGSKDFTSLDRLIPRINKIDASIEREELILKVNLQQLELMNTNLKGLTGLQYQVCKLREVDKLTYQQISQRLNIGERTVCRIMSIIKNKNK